MKNFKFQGKKIFKINRNHFFKLKSKNFYHKDNKNQSKTSKKFYLIPLLNSSNIFKKWLGYIAKTS